MLGRSHHDIHTHHAAMLSPPGTDSRYATVVDGVVYERHKMTADPNARAMPECSAAQQELPKATAAIGPTGRACPSRRDIRSGGNSKQ